MARRRPPAARRADTQRAIRPASHRLRRADRERRVRGPAHTGRQADDRGGQGIQRGPCRKAAVGAWRGRGRLLGGLVQRGRQGVPWAARRGRRGHDGGGPLSEAAYQPAGASRHGRRHAGEVGGAPLRDVAAGGRGIHARGRRGTPGSGGQADVHESWVRQERRLVRDRRAGGAAVLQGDGYQGHRAGRREAARHREGAGPRDPLHLHAIRGEHAEAPRHRRAHGCAFGRRPGSG